METKREESVELSLSERFRQERVFGAVFSLVFVLYACWPLVHGEAVRLWSLWVGGILALAGMVCPVVLVIPNRYWLRLGDLLHRVTSPVVLGLVFFGIFLPMSLLMPKVRRRFRSARKGPAVPSYWQERSPSSISAESFRNQF